MSTDGEWGNPNTEAVRLLPPQVVVGSDCQILRDIKLRHSESFHFLSDDISLCDSALFTLDYAGGSKHVTDLYLAGLAFANKWKLVTLDRSIPWQAVRGADATLIEIPRIA